MTKSKMRDQLSPNRRLIDAFRNIPQADKGLHDQETASQEIKNQYRRKEQP